MENLASIKWLLTPRLSAVLALNRQLEYSKGGLGLDCMKQSPEGLQWISAYYYLLPFKKNGIAQS